MPSRSIRDVEDGRAWLNCLEVQLQPGQPSGIDALTACEMAFLVNLPPP